MPTYEFKGPDGDLVERYYDMGQAPDVVEHKGVEYVRIISGGARPLVRNTGAKVTGWSLPWKGDPDMTPGMAAKVSSWTEAGVPVFDGHEKARAFCEESKRAQAAGEVERAYVYGEGPSPTEHAQMQLERKKVEA